ncbi:MAG TPA: ABC transporter ATP-binding protein [Chitinophagales bacterium]|nr:ABC transporter ATP-binding protein [Chitinophagales bacterium]HRK27971.1 ABC transporter ATP-binding protein [Chitinophagales bacterium]
MIVIENLCKQFGKLQALKNVNLTLSAGACIALVGPNGCGKTTLMKSILGMALPDKGTILFDGKDIKNEFAYRSRIGYMPQIGRYPDNMTIKQVIDMIKHLRHYPENQTDKDLITRYQINDLAHKRMSTLSGGTTQKVSAVLAFLFNPDVYILDEPTAGLDPIAAEILKDKIMEEKAKGKLILISSHLLNELDELITELIFMQDGEVLFHKKTDDLRNETGEAKISKTITNMLKKQMS